MDPKSSSSAFQAAIKEYLQTLPVKSNKRKVLVACISSVPPPSPQAVEEAIVQLERTTSDKPATRRIRKCLTPVIGALNDYSAILDTLAQADPMPSAVVWGSLKAVIQCSSRYLNLYETIRTQLNDLARHLGRLSCTAKLDKILQQVRQDADDVEKLVPIVQERIQRGERENAAEERTRAGIFRVEVSAFIQEQREDKVQRDLERKNATIWLSGAPGMGKSVLCAYAVEQIKVIEPASAVAFQYYRFDEQYTAIDTYRNLAEQLFDQFWDQYQDVPDSLHAHIQSSSSDPKNVKGFIELLMAQVPALYVLLDGLDEECDQRSKWTDALEVLDYLEGLTHTSPTTIRLWCSSQDRLCVRVKLTKYPTIHVSTESTSADIAKYLAKALPIVDVSEIDPGTKTVILEDLQGKAKGNFLWIHLMVQSLEQADNLDDIQRRIEEGLPLELDRYYERIFQSINVEQRNLACKIFSVVTFAKRPLLLEELSEAIGMAYTQEGSNLDSSKEPFRRRLKELCAPLIDVDDGGSGTSNVCTLAHSTVQSFLLKRPEILQNTEVAHTHFMHIVDERDIAIACLKYLSQPRYCELLVKSGDSFATYSGEDVKRHHLLSYAAKYWDKHLDSVEGDDAVADSVERFLRSSQFITCIQIQSLFVEGQFTLWIPNSSPFAGFRRTFPHWFTKSGQRGQQFAPDYTSFVAEWCHMLNLGTGEIDRCLWRALGPQNFLSVHANAGRYRSFAYVDKDKLRKAKPCRYYDRVNADGTKCVVVALDENSLGYSAETTTVPDQESSWALYKAPLRNEEIVTRAAPIAVDASSRILRVGSAILKCFPDGHLRPLSMPESNYVEEVAYREGFLATATRASLTVDDVNADGIEDEALSNVDDLFANLTETVSSSHADSGETATTTQTQSSSNDGFDKRNLSANSSRTSLDLGSDQSYDATENSWSDDDNKDDASMQESSEDETYESNSACESWSEPSTDPASDELEDNDQWNDFATSPNLVVDGEFGGSDAESLDIDEGHEELDSDTGLPDAKPGTDEKEEEEEEDALRRAVQGSDTGTSSDDESYRPDSDEDGSQSDTDSDEHTDASGSDSEVAQEKLDKLVWGKRKVSKSASRIKRGSIQVYKLQESQATRIFGFTIDLSYALLESPSIFHPSAPLVVWPLHGGEILFADFSRKTYFTRTLRASNSGSCFVFIKCNFSSDGRHIHIAALEARPVQHATNRIKSRTADDAPDTRPPLQLTLQVSTHRLSARKTSRAPPNLVSRTTVPLNFVTGIKSSHLPYTCTWSTEYLYFTTSNLHLDVIRVPLFKSIDGTQIHSPRPHVPKNVVYLPASACQRKVHYFPPPLRYPGAAFNQLNTTASVYIGSRSPQPDARNVLKKDDQVGPPNGFFLDEERDLGGWKERVYEDEGEGGGERGGRLVGKFEKFDLVEDCDIVPYFY
ncbi:MAG: hypothetical protein Q9170_004519 [Blastenia crenularia]